MGGSGGTTPHLSGITRYCVAIIVVQRGACCDGRLRGIALHRSYGLNERNDGDDVADDFVRVVAMQRDALRPADLRDAAATHGATIMQATVARKDDRCTRATGTGRARYGGTRVGEGAVRQSRLRPKRRKSPQVEQTTQR